MNLYEPSNGTEGEMFMTKFCYQCKNELFTHTNNESHHKCDILTRALVWTKKEPDYPTEWVIENNEPTCTAFVKHQWFDENNELQEVDLLLDKYIDKKKRPYADNSEEFREIPENSGEKFIGLKLKNKITNIEGTFLRYTHPTGKPLTTVIMTDNGEYFAPASEFVPCFPEDRIGGRM